MRWRQVPLAVNRVTAAIWIAIALAIFGLADVVTGDGPWFGPIYLLIIGFAAWTLGWREATAVSFVCIGISFAANGLALYPYGDAAVVWNLLLRLATVALVIAVLSRARHIFAREWKLARTDPLTGAFNRQAFFELASQWHHSPHWNLLAYADLDGLKHINDTLGHAFGDQVLQSFADAITRIIRKEDIFARLGGDEFIICMTVKDEKAAQLVAGRLHLAMNTVNTGLPAILRCSTGVLVLPPGLRSIDRDVKVADGLMYESKEQGAVLVVATGHERDGILYVAEHWDHMPTVAGALRPEMEIANAQPHALPAAVRPDLVRDMRTPARKNAAHEPSGAPLGIASRQ